MLKPLGAMDTASLLCLGDFNEILEQREKQGNYPTENDGIFLLAAI